MTEYPFVYLGCIAAGVTGAALYLFWRLRRAF